MTSINFQILKEHFLALRDPAYEPGLSSYRQYLGGLNEVCRQSGDPLEGNLFYSVPPPQDFQETLTLMPEPRFRDKRRDYANYVFSGTSMLEIGFNGGHSALLALSVNPNLKYVGVDFGNHPYTRPCFDYLKDIFGTRIDLLIGDSRELVPAIRHMRQMSFDLFHIDGGHDFGVAYTDICNVIDMCKDGDVILFDDTNSGVAVWQLDEICDFFIIKGIVSRVQCSRLWQSDKHVLLRVNKGTR